MSGVVLEVPGAVAAADVTMGTSSLESLSTMVVVEENLPEVESNGHFSELGTSEGHVAMKVEGVSNDGSTRAVNLNGEHEKQIANDASQKMEGIVSISHDQAQQCPILQQPVEKPSSPQSKRARKSKVIMDDDEEDEEFICSTKSKNAKRGTSKPPSTSVASTEMPKFNGPLYQEIPRVDASKMTPEQLQEYLCSVPIAFVQGMMDCLDPKLFTMSHFASEHGDVPVDVLVQDPDAFGFGVPANKKMDHTVREYVQYAQELENEVQDKMQEIDRRVFSKMSGEGTDKDCSIGDFVGRVMPFPDGNVSSPSRGTKRQGKAKSMTPTSEEGLGERNGTDLRRSMMGSSVSQPLSSSPHQPQQKMIRFCVNVDCGEWPSVIKELSKLPDWCKWGDNDALLGKLPKMMTIPGMSLPQLYMKVPGVWTGGHEENIRFHSINNNHGPGNSIWGSIAPEHAARFRELVLEKQGVDIYHTEGRWFPDFEFCAENGIPVMVGVQRPGDTAILNGGTLHWVRSGGFAVNSSWNFGVRTAEQLDMAFERDKINYKLEVRNIVPLRSLMIEVLADVRAKQTKEVSLKEMKFLECAFKHLNEQVMEETKYLTELEAESQERMEKPNVQPMEIFLEPLNSLVLLCDRCWREIVHHHVVCNSCAECNEKKGVSEDVNKALPVFFCVPCGLAHARSKKSHETEARYKCFEEEVDLEVWIKAWKEWFDANIHLKEDHNSPSATQHSSAPVRPLESSAS